MAAVRLRERVFESLPRRGSRRPAAHGADRHHAARGLRGAARPALREALRTPAFCILTAGWFATPPVLVVTGLHDRVFRVEEGVRALTARLPRAQAVGFEGAGPLVPVERPETFHAALLAFAARL